MFFHTGEKALAFVRGSYNKRSTKAFGGDFLIVTTERLIFWSNFQYVSESIYYSVISNIGLQRGRPFGVLSGFPLIINHDNRVSYYYFLSRKDMLDVTSIIINYMKKYSYQVSQQEDNAYKNLQYLIDRTDEMELSDLGSLFGFSDRTSLLNWLYSLPKSFVYKIKGNTIQFPKSNIKKENNSQNDLRKLKCLYCSEDLEDMTSSRALFCPSCGKKTPICEICKNIIVAGQKILLIKTCEHFFHKDHIIEWLNAKGTCPLCREKITEKDLIPFQLE